MSKITESARDEECQIRYLGVCSNNPDAVVWCHANGSAAGKGIGMKSPDLLGAYGCFACHNLYDRRTPIPAGMTRVEVELVFWQGHARSVLILIEKGIVTVDKGRVTA